MAGTRGPSRPWTAEDEARLRANYRGRRDSALMALFPGRTRASVATHIQRLGLTGANAPRWTAAEDAVLRREYRGNPAAFVARLPGRSAKAIQVRAVALGVTVPTRWSPTEDAILRREWHDVGARTLKGKLPGRTWHAIRGRAILLGLPLGIPQGCETVWAAAARTGFSYDGLEQVLAWAGVRLRYAYPAENRGVFTPGKHAHRFAERDEVDEAVRRWLRSEHLAPAARERGIHPETLRAWLAAEGLVPPVRGPGERRSRLRILTEDIERVIAARRGGGLRRAS
jgi:hypothetical protein